MSAHCSQIFISYAPEDTGHLHEFVRVLRPFVRQQQVRTWCREDLVPGENVGTASTQQLGAADVVVLLLSADFVANDECYGEALRSLDELDRRSRCVIAVRLRPFLLAEGDPLGKVQITLPTHRRTVAECDTPDDAWVHVATEVMAAAQRLTVQTTPTLVAPPPLDALDLVGDALFEATLLHPLALGCDRRAQWGALDQLVNNTTRDDLILVTGELDKGHTYFLQRVGKFLRRDPSRHIVAVWWDRTPFPACEDEYREQIAAVLGCPPAALCAQMQRILFHHNLILLHRTVSDKFPTNSVEQERCLRLFGEWLPRLIATVRDGRPGAARSAGRAVKCIQPVAWRPVSALKETTARMFALLFGKAPSGMEEWLHEHRAIKFLHALERTGGPLTVQRLANLADISDEDLRDICKQAEIPGPHWRRFIADARRLGPTPEKLHLGLSRLLRDPSLKATP